MPSNFSGSWKCVEVGDTGDFGDFLKLMGVPWFIRKIAKFDRYGANKETEVITMESASHFKVVNNGPRKVITQEFRIDGTEQSTISIPAGENLLVSATWDGDALVMRTQVPGATHWIEARRSFDAAGRMRLDLTATRHDGSGQASTSRIYERTADGAGSAGWATAAVEAEVAEHGERPETPRAGY